MSESPPPSADAIQKWLMTAENLIALIADNLRRGTWVKRLLLVDALIVFGLNPGMAGQILKIFVGLEQLPDWYTRSFWLAVGLLFAIALVIALRTPVRSQTDIAEFKERKAIKGLRPFTAADTEIFAKLQRNRSLKECLEAITQDSFRFGILLGESGCGKTSFLRAGLVPALSDPAATHRGVYIQFNDRAPVDTIREALVKELNFESGIEGDGIAAFQELLTRAQAAVGKPLILVFDQFEQFFVHYKTKEKRQRFVSALTEWYRSSLPVKILISIRGDMSDRLVELQHAMRYSLGPQDMFPLEKFAPPEAVAVLRVIAETEALKFDERFMQELTERELARDGLISPVDLQILSWMIERQNTAELKAFDRLAFQKFGGMEGLLTRFLEKMLEAQVIKSQREAAVKVLLALTDLERNLRAGVLTVAELQAKSPGTQPDEIAEAAVWLGRSDVRLITPVERDAETVYELAHERLIPAVRQVAGKELTQAQKANQLLDRRVNEWVGNHRNPRYLFSWHELRLLEQQKPYLVWGSNRPDKERLITRSKRRMYRSGSAVAALLLILATGWAGLESPSGQRWQMRRELVEVSQNVDDPTKVQAALTLAGADGWQQALKLCEQIQNPYHKSTALSSLAGVDQALEQPDQAILLLQQALQAANRVQDPYDKSDVLIKIAVAYNELNQLDKADPVLQQALEVTNQIQDFYSKSYALTWIASTYNEFNQDNKNEGILWLLYQSLQVANQIQDEFNRARAVNYVATEISVFRQPDKTVSILQQALLMTDQIQNQSAKAYVLGTLSIAHHRLNQREQTILLLQHALQAVSQVQDSYTKSEALTWIAEAYGKTNNPDQAIVLLQAALQAANQIQNNSNKSDALGEIARITGYLNQSEQSMLLLQQMLQATNQIQGLYYRILPLSWIAQAYANFGHSDKAAPLLQQILAAADQIADSENRTYAIRSSAKSYAKDGNWKQSREIVEKCDTNFCKISALSEVLTVWTEQQHPELKEEE